MAITITKPTVGGNEDTWGTTLNTALDTIVDAVNGTTGTTAPNLSTLTINSVDVTATPAELNLLDGATAATSTTVVGTDRVVFNDGGTMKQVSMSDIATYTTSQVPSTTVNDATITITAGNALTGGGNFTTDQASNETITINHQDTSSQASVNNSGNTFIQDITLDTYGHITVISSVSVDMSAIGGYGALQSSANFSLTNSTSSWTAVTLSDGQTMRLICTDDSSNAKIKSARNLNAQYTLATAFPLGIYTNSTGSNQEVYIDNNSGNSRGYYEVWG